jgi:hypothetical protein
MRIPGTGSGASQDAPVRLSPNIVVLGVVSLLMGMSSAMIYGLLPVFLVTVLGASMTSVGVIEGLAEATNSLTKIFSGVTSDWIGRRKPLVLLGYGLSAVNKLLFPLAGAASAVLLARVVDRIGKGIRDAPRDALLTDVTPSKIRGAGFGLRLALYTIGAVAGPLIAIGLMRLSGDDFRLVFWVAAIPGFASVAVLYFGVKEPPWRQVPHERHFPIRRTDLTRLALPLWWAVSVAAILSLARFSPAFIVLKTHDVGIGNSTRLALYRVWHTHVGGDEVARGHEVACALFIARGSCRYNGPLRPIAGLPCTRVTLASPKRRFPSRRTHAIST